MVDNKLISVPTNVDDPDILKKFLTELVGKLEGNPLITYPVNYQNSAGIPASDMVNVATTQNDILTAAMKTNAIRGEIKRYITSDLETKVLANKDDVSTITEQFGTFSDTATAAAWYGLGVKAGEVITGLTIGSIDTDTTTPGSGGSFFAINADSFQVAKSIEDITDQAELDYLNANNLPYGTMFDANTNKMIPAFQIDWDTVSSEYKIYFNGTVTFGNVSGTSHLVTENDPISRLDNDLGYSTDALAQQAYALAQTAKDIADGVTTTWFYAYGDGVAPTTSDLPSSDWTTDEDKINHLGDLTYNKDDGKAYRYTYSNNTYAWALISDNDISKALADAAKAQDTADHKRRVFMGEPTTPYDIGDLWSRNINGSNQIWKADVAKTDIEAYSEADWSVASTDDNAVVTLESGLNNGTVNVSPSAIQIDSTNLDDYLSTEKDEKVNVFSGSDHTAQTGMTINDLYIETKVVNGLSVTLTYKYNGSSWVNIANSDGLIATKDLADGKRTIFNNSVTVPTGEDRDIWIPGATFSGYTKGEIYQWKSGIWVLATKYTGDIDAVDFKIKKIFKSDFTYNSIDDVYMPYRVGTGAASLIIDAESTNGGKSLVATNGEVWAELGDFQPYNPDKLYRIKARVKQVTAASTEKTYVGICAYDKDFNPINIHGSATHSSQHYIAVNGANVPNQYTEYVGYFTGEGVDGTSGGPHHDVNDPALVITGAKYFRPLVILNYNIDDINEARCDYIEVEDITDIQNVSEDLTDFVDVTYATDKANMQGLIDNKIESFFQDTSPYDLATVTAEHNGDMWFDTANNLLYRLNYNSAGSTWALIRDQKANDAYSAAVGAQSTADGKITTYVQDVVPANPDIGDLWLPKDNVVLTYNGSTWVSAKDNLINLIENDDWSKGLVTVTKYSSNTALSDANVISLRLAGTDQWSPADRDILQVKQGGPLDTTDALNIYIHREGYSNTTGWPAVPGRKYAASAYLGAHRCNAKLIIVFRDSNNAWLNAYSSDTNSGNSGAAAEDADNLFSVSAIAPDNTAFAQIVVAKYDTYASQTSSYVFVHKPMLAEVDINSVYDNNIAVPYVKHFISELANKDMSNVTTIDGGLISTGKVQSNDGSTYFDLNNNQIKMNNGDFILDSQAAGDSTNPNIQGGYIKGTTIDGALVKAGRFVPSRPVTNTGALTFYEGYLGFQTVTQDTTGSNPYMQEVICYTGIASPSFNLTSTYNYFRLLGGQQTVYISKYIDRLNSYNYTMVTEYDCANDILVPSSGVVKLGLSLYIGDTLIVEGGLLDLYDDKISDSYGYRYEPYIYDFNTGTYITSKVYIDYYNNRVRLDLRNDIGLKPEIEGEIKIVLRFHKTDNSASYDFNSTNALASSIYQTVTQTPQIVKSLGILI